MNEIVNLFSIFSDKTRLRILLLLINHELCVCDIFEALEMSQPRVSRQLALLKQARLIKDRREGKWIYYKTEENNDTLHCLQILELMTDWLKDDHEVSKDKAMLNQILCMKDKMGSCCKSSGKETIGK